MFYVESTLLHTCIFLGNANITIPKCSSNPPYLKQFVIFLMNNEWTSNITEHWIFIKCYTGTSKCTNGSRTYPYCTKNGQNSTSFGRSESKRVKCFTVPDPPEHGAESEPQIPRSRQPVVLLVLGLVSVAVPAVAVSTCWILPGSGSKVGSRLLLVQSSADPV